MMSIHQYFHASVPNILHSHQNLIPSQLPQPKHSTQHITQTTLQQYISEQTNATPSNHLDHIGDALSDIKPDHVLRLYIQNVNGIQLDTSGGDLNSIATEMCRIQADIIALIETNIDNTKYPVQEAIQRTLRKYIQHYKYCLSGTSIPTATNYKPGGLLSWTQGNSTGRIKAFSSDPLGRWIHWHLNGKSKDIHLIFVYQVCHVSATTANLNTMTAFSQQSSILRQQQRPHHTNPRHHFILDLQELVSQVLSNKNHELLIAGDFNEEFGVDIKGITKLANTYHLHDVFLTRTSHSTFNTYSRGKRRIDYALSTKGLLSTIVAAGYEPFHHRLVSDHRGMFIDIDTQALFGNHTSPLAPAPSRGLQSSNRKSNRLYIEAMYSHLNSNNIDKLLEHLEASSPTSTQISEKIDKLLVQASLSAENKSKKPTRPPQTHELRQARLQYNATRKLLYFFRNHPNDKSHIQHIISSNSPLAKITNKQECVELLRSLRSSIRNLAKTEATRFAQQLEKELLDAELANDTKLATALKNLRRRQEQQRMYNKLRNFRTNNSAQILTSIKIPKNPKSDPKSCNDWIEVTEPTKINEFILQRNKRHFGQAYGTPFTVTPLSDQIPFTGIGEYSDLILDGEYDTSQLSEITSLFIKSLQQRLHPNQDAPQIQMEDYKTKIRLWKETTSTSPSGVHLGHYHALIKQHDIPTTESEKYADLEDKREFLLQTRLQLLNFALRHGYSFQRWQQIVNVMILKKPGDTRIHRLRVIHIYEADYNLLLSMSWRSAIHSAEDNNVINQGQFGGRPGRTAHDPVFIEEQVQEYSRLTRYSSIKFANDATACYDRILPSLASLASRSFGTHQSVCYIMAQTLLEAQYKLKTSLGLSDQQYKHCSSYPIYGSGQGSGNSPVIWVFLSSVLFDCHNKAAHGASFTSVSGDRRLHISIIGFVDDSTGYCNARGPDDEISTLFEKMQHDAQLWNNLLWQSGGDLELSKCLYHVSDFKFTPRGEPTLHNYIPKKISVPSNTEDCNLVIRRSSPFTDHETLGCFKSPSGHQTQQLLILREKSNKHLKIILSNPFYRHEAWTYYFAIFMPSVGYCLPVSHFSENDLYKVQQKPTRALLAKAGFNRNTKKEIVFGPKSLGGLAWQTLYDVQGIGQITLYLKHWRSNTFISNLLHINFTWTMAQIGTSFSPLENTTIPLPHLETKWFSSMRHYLSTFDGTISLQVAPVNTLQRIHDQCIMDVVLDSGIFTKREIRQINYCRLYLQVITISDISSATGTCLRPEIRYGDFLLTSSRTTWKQFKQDKPDETSWRVWRRACKLFATDTGRLHQPLQSWLYSHDQLRQSWFSYFDIASATLFIRTAQQYQEYKTDHSDIYYATNNLTSTLPTTSVPVDVSPSGTKWRLSSPVHSRHTTVSSNSSDFKQFLASQPPWSRNLHLHLQLHVSIYSVIDSIQDDAIVVTSDGSVSINGEGSFGWVAALSSGTRLATCAGWAYGCTQGASMRAEAYGFLSWVQFLTLLHKYHTIEWPEPLLISQYTDSESLLIRIQKLQEQEMPSPNLTLLEDWDIIHLIVALLETLPTYERTHVKGHQDDQLSFEDLPLPAQLNVEADQLAGSMHRLPPPHNLSTVIQFPTNPAQLNIQNKTCNGKYPSRIRHARYAKPLEAYIMERQSLSQLQFQSVNHRALATVISAMSPRYPILIKLVHSHIPLNTVTSRYDKETTSVCPGCDVHVEDFVHHFKCTNAELAQSRKQLLQKLRLACDQISSDPCIRDTLLYGLESFFGGARTAPSTVISDLYDIQSDIGWIKILQGRFANKWTDLQSHHYSNQTATKHTGQTWTTLMIKIIFTWYITYWELRNTCKHGKDVSQRAAIRKLRVLEEMRAVYEMKEQVLSNDRSIFFDTFEEHTQNKTTTQMQNWLSIWRPTIIQSVKHAKSWAIKGVRTINHYFQFQPD